MNQKTIIVFIILVLLGCGLPGCKTGKSSVPTSKGNDNIEVMKALDDTINNAQDKKTVSQGNQDLAEMRHWKYAVSGPLNDGTADSGGEEDGPSKLTDQDDNMAYFSYPSSGQSGTYSSEVLNVQLITEEEMDAAVDCLVAEGYLSMPIDESQFANALKKYQSDNGLPVSGLLDSATRTHLRGK
jgi:hypothetical protein